MYTIPGYISEWSPSGGVGWAGDSRRESGRILCVPGLCSSLRSPGQNVGPLRSLCNPPDVRDVTRDVRLRRTSHGKRL